MIWDRERYISHVLFENTGREMFSELFGPLHILEEEWRRAGVPEKEIGMTAFDWDYVPTVRLAGKTGAVTGIRPVILNDTPEETLSIDAMGRHSRLIKSSATISHPIDHPVSGFDDWEKVRRWYTFDESRIGIEKLPAQKKLRDAGQLSLLSIPGAFNEPRELMGEEALCLACYEEPEMLSDMMNTFADVAIRVIERVGAVVPIDCICIHEDMAGKSGPMFGPKQVREFMYPYYTRVFDAARAFGARIFSVDSDGDVSPILSDLIDCGVNCLHPCEPVGGMDIVKLRTEYGKKICFKGGIDKFALRGTKEDIRRELEYRLSPTLFGGGTVFGLDHRIPNGVPIENYRYYVKLGREMLGLPPISGEGWGRVAF